MSASLRPRLVERVVLTRHGASAIVIERQLLLTDIQLRCLALVAVGLSNDTIGRLLCQTPSTVKGHLTRAYRQIGCDGPQKGKRIKAAHWYRAHMAGTG